MALIILIIFIAILLLGTPIGFAIGSLTYTSFLILGGNMASIPQKMYGGIDSYTFVCVLLYILATDIMTVGGITNAILRFCNTLVGHIRGGLAHVNVLASMMFAGLSGSAIADASGLGPLEIDMMVKGGYDRTFSTSVTAASAVIGPIIPPSNIMIIFASCVGTVSIGKMFVAGAVPGVLLGLGYMVLIYIMSVKNHYPKKDRPSTIKEIGLALWHTAPALFLPVIIVGTIITGICTATEAGALAVLYAIIISVARKNLSFSAFFRCCIRSAKATANVLFIIAVSQALGWAITTLQIAQGVAEFCAVYLNNKYVFLLFLNVLLLIVGMLLDATPAMLLLVPILLPSVNAFGIDIVHFGIIVCLNLMIGNITPPVGMLLFVCSNVGKTKLSALYKGILPFCAAAIVVLLLVTYVPWTTSFLPNLMGA